MHRPTKRKTPSFAVSLRSRAPRRSPKLRNSRSPVKDLSSSAEVDLDFRNLIQEIDTAMQRRLENRTSLPGRVRESNSSLAEGSPWKDELYQYISHLPEEGRKKLTVERVGGLEIVSEKAQKASIEVQTNEGLLKTAATVQTEDAVFPILNPGTGPSSFPHTSSPEVQRKAPSKRKKPETSSLRESAGLASIRQLLTSAVPPLSSYKRGEVVVTEDCPTLSLSSLFKTRRRALYLRMQERANSLSPQRNASPQAFNF